MLHVLFKSHIFHIFPVIIALSSTSLVIWQLRLHLPGQGVRVQSLVAAQTVKNLPAVWETWVLSLGQEDPLEEGMATHSSLENPMDRGGWWVNRRWGCKELDTTDFHFFFFFFFLEESTETFVFS